MARSSLMTGLRALFRHQAICDVTLICQGETISAHKVVLVSCSRFLAAAILSSDCTTDFQLDLDNCVSSEQFDPSIVKRIITYIYEGVLDDDLTLYEVKELYRTAVHLQVDSALRYLQSVIESKQYNVNLCEHTEIAKLLFETDQVQQIVDDIYNTESDDGKRVDREVQTETEDTLSSSEPILLTTDHNISADEEDDVLDYDNDLGVDVNTFDNTSGIDCEMSPRDEIPVIPSSQDSTEVTLTEEQEQESTTATNTLEVTRPKRKTGRPKKVKPRKRQKFDDEVAYEVASDDGTQKLLHGTETEVLEIVSNPILFGVSTGQQQMPSKPFDIYKSPSGVYKCPDCEFTSKSYNQLSQHLRKHRGDRPFHCTMCEKTFTCSKHLKSHLRTHSDERPFQCEVCGAAFKDPKHRNRHKKLHSAEKIIECSEKDCTARFVDIDRMRKHVQSQHRDEKPHKCDHPGCQYAATSRHAITVHKVTHLPQCERETVLCDICGKPLNGARSIKLHMLLHGGQEIKCSICDYKSVFKGAVKSHMHRLHGLDMDGKKVDKKFQCEKCGFEAYFISEFKFHMSKHTGERPYKCSECDFDTNDKGTLKKHQRSHTGEKPFKCQDCGEAYTNQSALARHKRSHSGEKPFKCDECDATYADKKSLVAHKYKHKGIKPFMCHICSYTCVKKQNLVSHICKTHGEEFLPENLKPKEGDKKYRPRKSRARLLPSSQHQGSKAFDIQYESQMAVSNIEHQPLMVTDMSEIQPQSRSHISQQNVMLMESTTGMTTTTTILSLPHPVQQSLPAHLVHMEDLPHDHHQQHVVEFHPSHVVGGEGTETATTTDLAPLLRVSGIRVVEAGTLEYAAAHHHDASTAAAAAATSQSMITTLSMYQN